MKKMIQKAIAQANKKGLKVNKNRFAIGWSITLPSGAGFHALSDSEMVKYIQAY